MGRVNPETTITTIVRRNLERLGAVFIKFSDSFTRGIPDSLVCISRPVLVEYKVDRQVNDRIERTWKSLGLSGAQDHFIKAFAGRCDKSACVVTNTVKHDRLKLWVPVRPEDEVSEYYECVARGEEVYAWLT